MCVVRTKREQLLGEKIMKIDEKKIEKLREVYIKSFDILEAVNWGGCGWSAYIMCKALRRQGITADVYFIDPERVSNFKRWNNTDNFNKACRKVLNKEKGYQIPNGHLVVKVGDYYMDSEGDPTRDNDIAEDSRISLGSLKRSLRYAVWNSTFRCSNENWSRKKVRVIRKVNDNLKGLIL